MPPVPPEPLPCPGRYHLHEEVADLLQDDDDAGGGVVVRAVSTEEPDSAQRSVHIGLQLRERSLVSAGPRPR